MKCATLFSGGELAGVGLRNAGLSHAWGLEYDDQIAEVARVNGFNVHTLDILKADPEHFEAVDLLHASPPCPSFSVASQGEETELDMALSERTADFIRYFKPKYFTLENVYGYRKSKSWGYIRRALNESGYLFDLAHVNFADLGVPQTRKRMIVRAVRGGWVPYLPKPDRWVGWYEAIEDLLDELPASKFADWQLARLPEGLVESSFVGTQGKPLGVSRPDEPARTIVSDPFGGAYRAFLMAGSGNTNMKDAKPGGGVRYPAEPAHVVAVPVVRRNPRAFIVSGLLNKNSTEITVRDEHQPGMTVTTSHNQKDLRAWLSRGRVVKMTPRALARFQSLPDEYQLPDKPSLAVKIIGNGVPSLGMEKMVRGLVR